MSSVDSPVVFPRVFHSPVDHPKGMVQEPILDWFKFHPKRFPGEFQEDLKSLKILLSQYMSKPQPCN